MVPPEEAAQAKQDAAFCSTHVCIANYAYGRGVTTLCADGQYSRSGGIQGACSHHGGRSGSFGSQSFGSKRFGSSGFGGTRPNAPTPNPWASSGSVHVDGYYRSDGTYVHPYTRSASGSVWSAR